MIKQAVLPKLYEYSACPFCWRVRALFDFHQQPFEAIEVHPLNKKEIAFSKDYRKVPILLDDDGHQINDSIAIMRYLDTKYSEEPLFGIGRDDEERWLLWSDKIFVRSLPPLIYKSVPASIKAFDYITKIGKFSWLQKRLIKYSGALVMTMVAKKSAKSQHIADPESHFLKCLDQWVDALLGKPFFGGEKVSGVDLVMYGTIKSIENLNAFQFVKANKTVYDWYCRVAKQRSHTA